MFPRPNPRFSKAALYVLGAATIALGGVLPAVAQEECESSSDPYVFILLDTSGSMSWAPPCSQNDFNVGSCSHLCNAPECYVPLQADSPSSKFFQVKAGLYDALSSTESESVLFGFATFNQDSLNVRSKHWLYGAAGNGVTIPGWGPFPAIGSSDVLGRTWACDEGSGDQEVGCVATNPADLSDAWERERVRMLAKGGETFSTTVTFYVRQAPAVYRIRYTPWTGALGSPVSLKVRVDRCLNSSCSSVSFLGEPTLPYVVISEHLVWDNGASRTQPIGYFGESDASASNTCSGWEPNTDSSADPYSSYSLRWTTDASDPRGTFFVRGDMLPLDWLADHRQDIQKRLAPNIVLDPFATPDFRTSPHLRNVRNFGESFLRLKNEQARPLVASGSTPLGEALKSFRTWFVGCDNGICDPLIGWSYVAWLQDPEWTCRQRNIVLITDGAETCGGNPCAAASMLLEQDGVRTFVIGYGADPFASQELDCIAAEGGTGSAVYPRTPDELSWTLRQIFGAAREP